MIQTNIVKVGMADLNVLAGSGILKTTGLGSCVGLTLYDRVKKISGMAHVMLPDSSIARDGVINKAKYADTAVPELLAQMEKLGARRERLEAKLAGGAQMFAFSSNTPETMRIGPRNVESCREALRRLAIPIVAEDTGGNYGRSIELDGDTGMLVIRSANRGVKEI